MADKKTILVTGATGAQGGGVAHHLLNGGKFAVRALTRNPDSEKAAALKQAGAEVVQGDLEDTESLKRALDGVYGVYGVTNFWEHFEREREHGMHLVDAVAAAANPGVEHFIFSSLPNVKKETGGTLNVAHFDLKAEVEEYARERIANPTFVHVAFYFDNFIAFTPPQKQADGTFAFGFPQGDTPLAGVAVDDVGGVVSALFDRPDESRGNTYFIGGDVLPPAQYAQILSRVTGKTVRYNYIPRETFANLGFPGAEELADMYEYYRVHVQDQKPAVEQCRALYPALQDFETWAQSHRDALVNAMGG